MVPTAQERFVSCRYVGFLLRNRHLLVRRQPDRKRICCAVHYLVLEGKDVGKRAIEPLRPHMTSSQSIDEVRIDSDPVSSALHTPFEDIADTQFLRDLSDFHRLSLVRE